MKIEIEMVEQFIEYLSQQWLHIVKRMPVSTRKRKLKATIAKLRRLIEQMELLEQDHPGFSNVEKKEKESELEVAKRKLKEARIKAGK